MIEPPLAILGSKWVIVRQVQIYGNHDIAEWGEGEVSRDAVKVKERNSAVRHRIEHQREALPANQTAATALYYRTGLSCASFSFRVAISSARIPNDPDCAVNNAVSNILEGSEKHIATL